MPTTRMKAAAWNRSVAGLRGVEGEAPISDTTYAQIRTAIAEGIFVPGSRLRERDVALRLNVSRTPVREALRRLELEGLLAAGPTGSMQVAKLDREMVIELYQMREAMEGTAARLAAKHAREAEITLMKQIVSEEESSFDQPEGLGRLNYALHQTICGAARNRYLVQGLNLLRDSMMLLRPMNLADKERARNSHAEHADIVDAISKGDSSRAGAAAEAHIRGALVARLREL